MYIQSVHGMLIIKKKSEIKIYIQRRFWSLEGPLTYLRAFNFLVICNLSAVYFEITFFKMIQKIIYFYVTMHIINIMAIDGSLHHDF